MNIQSRIVVLLIAFLIVPFTSIQAAELIKDYCEIREMLNAASQVYDLEKEDAVILLDDFQVEMTPIGTMKTSVHTIVRIANHIGREHYADLRIPFDASKQNFVVTALNTWCGEECIKSDSTAIVETLPFALSTAYDYANMREMILMHDGIELPCVIETAYYIEDTPPFNSPPAKQGGMGHSANSTAKQGGLLRCIRNQLGEPDASGRRRPEPIPGSEFEIPIDTIIDAVGEYPDASRFSSDKDIQNTLIKIDKWGKTGIEGVWAGGDFSAAEWSVTHAIGAGKRAALDIDLYLNNSDRANIEGLILSDNNAVSVTDYINNSALPIISYNNHKQVDFSELNLAYHPIASTTAIRELSPEVRKADFTEIVKDWRISSAVREAKRCFHCGTCDSCGNCHVFCPDGAVTRDPVTGALSFDLEHCKGCGVCEEECPRAAIEMRK